MAATDDRKRLDLTDGNADQIHKGRKMDMKKLMRSFAIYFSMYSRIPMPRTEWEKDSMRYVFCFFPLIGLVIGILQAGWFWAAEHFAVPSLLYAAVASVLPILITGGIHLDGYMDTCDALFSYGDREKKLEIMKDPHTGAFAVIYCGVYLLLLAGFFAGLYQAGSWIKMAVVGVGYLLSRTVCGLATVWMPCAKNSGLAHMFQNNADRKTAKIALTIWFVGLLCLLGFLSLQTALFAVSFIGLAVIAFISMTKKQFGGITGDLAGFLLQICELLILLAAMI